MKLSKELVERGEQGSSVKVVDNRGLPMLVLLGVFLLATVHNYLGVLAAFLLVLSLPDLQRGRLFIGGFAAAFYIAASFALIRMIFPAASTLVDQLQEVIRFIALALFSTVIWRMSSEDLLRALRWFFLLILVSFPIYLATDVFSIVDASGARRFSGLMPHANHLGYIAASTALTLMYLMNQRVAPKRAGLMLAVLVGLVLVTRSSGALLVLAFGLVAYILSLRLTFKRVLTVLLGFLLLAVVLQSSVGQLVLEKFSVIDLDAVLSKSENYQFGNQGSSLAWRMSYWAAMVNEQILSGPWAVLFGQGGGAATLGSDLYFFMEKDPHSDFVKMFIEYGVIGSLLIFGLLIRAAWLTGARFFALVILFGPMLTGNSLTSSPVIFVLLCNVMLLYAVKRRAQ